MTWTRAQYLDRTRRVLDAVGSKRWDDTIDVPVTLGLVHTREWKRILDANRYYRTNTLTLAQDANGQLAFTAFDQGAADAQQRFYRVLWVSDGVRVYDEVQWSQVPTAATTGATNYAGLVWYPTGSGTARAVQVLPAAAGLAMTVVVNHTPTPMDQLSADSIAAEFPRDYEMLLCYEAAAWLATKGGAEMDLTQGFQRMADQIRSDMLGDLVRVSTDPTRIAFPDSPSAWAGI